MLLRSARTLLATSTAAVAALLACAGIASAGTVSLWHMDETAGATMVDSVGGNDGTLHNIALGQPGFLNGAYGFNGSNSVVTGPTAGGLNAGASPFWFGARIKFANRPSAAVVDYDLMRKGLSSASGGFWKIEVFPSGQIHCSMEGSSTSRSLTAGPDLSDNQWHSVYCLKDDTSERVIVDGVVVGTEAVSLGSFGNSAVLAVGAKAEGGDQYDGLMDEASYGTGTTLINSAPPAIGGTPVPGSALSARTGTWDGLPEIAYSYQWQRCDAAGSACGIIAGATQGNYTPVAGDLGSTLRVAVTAKNALDQQTATSPATGVVAATGTGTPPTGGGSTPSSPGTNTPVGGAGPLSPPPGVVATSCARLRSSAALRQATLRGGKTITLRFAAATGTGTLTFRAPRRTISSVSFTLDGKRIATARGGSLKKILRAPDLARGRHVLRATVRPRNGNTRTLTMRLTVSAC
jgi:hypothetical protein